MNGATLLDRALDAAVVPGYSRVGYALRRLAWAGAPEGHLDGRALAGNRRVLARPSPRPLHRLPTTSERLLWDECDRLSMRFVSHSAISSC